MADETIESPVVEDTLKFTIVDETIVSSPSDSNLSVTTVEETINVSSSEEQLNVNTVEETLKFSFNEVMENNLFTADPAVINQLLNRSTSELTMEAFPAGEALGGNRVVYLNAGKWWYASNDQQYTSSTTFGITKYATSIDQTAIVQTAGEMVENTWNWDVNSPILLGLNGILTQVRDTEAINIVIGSVISPTQIYINIQRPIKLI